MQILTVSEVNRTARLILEADGLLQDLYVRGEISNLKLHASGHVYFSLKDELASLRAVMFRSRAQRLPFLPENGLDVLCRGRVSLFERDGAFQLYVEDMEPAGLGAQHLALLQLRERLDREGLFAQERKRPLPLVPRRIGVVTSASGAAVRDIITVARRRHPGVSLVIAPVLVQGSGAPASIVRAMEDLQAHGRVDVIIIGRGGGSKEDLQAFNDEAVVRAVAASTVPTVSAVGHETDTSLTDYAADRRAPTPSAAAEMAVPVRSELLLHARALEEGLAKALRHRVRIAREGLSRILDRRVMVRPTTFLEPLQERISRLERGLSQAVVEKLLRQRARFLHAVGRLDGLSPLGTLARGYAVLQKDGRVVRSARDVGKGDRIEATLAEGSFWSLVEETSLDV